MVDKTNAQTDSQAAPTKKAGFDDKGKPYPGVSPEGERMAVTYAGLVAEFGKAKGEQKYNEIALAGQFLSPTNAPYDNRPDLNLVSLKSDVRAKVDEILAKE